MQSLVEFEIITFLRNYCVMFLLGVDRFIGTDIKYF